VSVSAAAVSVTISPYVSIVLNRYIIHSNLAYIRELKKKFFSLFAPIPNTVERICCAVFDAALVITERPAEDVRRAPATTHPVANAIFLVYSKRSSIDV